MKFFVYTFAGSAFLLVGILALAFIHERQTGRDDLRPAASSPKPTSAGSRVLLLRSPSPSPSP